MTINSDLKCDKHIYDLCDKVRKKLNALCRIEGEYLICRIS